MTQTSLISGILIALMLSAISLPLRLALAGLGVEMASQVLIVLLALGYMAYLATRSPSRIGRVTLGILSITVLFGACVFGASPWHVGLLAVGLIWLVRTLLHYASVMPAIIDGLLCMVSVGCAFAAFLLTGSVFGTVWCFFLCQALFVFIPRRFKRSGLVPTRADDPDVSRRENFARAYRAAEQAICRLAQQTAT